MPGGAAEDVPEFVSSSGLQVCRHSKRIIIYFVSFNRSNLICLHFRGNSTKPSIILVGDDSGQAFTLTRPTSELKGDWNYKVTPFLDTGSGTVGEIAKGDVDQDGHDEVFVSAYNQNKVYVYRI